MEEGVVLGGDINIIRPKSQISSEFLTYLFNFNKYEFIRLVTGTTVKHLYISDIKHIKLHFPILEEQQKIANFLKTIDTKISHVEKNN